MQWSNEVSNRLDYNRIAPAGLKALGTVHGYVSQSGLSPVLVDLTIAISLMNAYNRRAISFRNTPRAALAS
jgi:hypothetical protein